MIGIPTLSALPWLQQPLARLVGKTRDALLNHESLPSIWKPALSIHTIDLSRGIWPTIARFWYLRTQVQSTWLCHQNPSVTICYLILQGLHYFMDLVQLQLAIYVRYVLKIHSNFESGPKTIQFNIHSKIKSEIFIQYLVKNIQLKNWTKYSKLCDF